MFSTKNALRLFVVMGVVGWAGTAMSQDKVHHYLNDASLKVKAATSPEQKREILSTSLGAMTRAIDTVKGAPLTTEQDRTNLNLLQADLQDKSDELIGVNGFDRVPDNQLNAFSTYVVQDIEQADQTITISLVVALLIVIILILVL
ncbi:MAG TPA: hypothetical protein VJS69_05360 [Candidatus Krumholzibacteria bacterium]|nr:hypothetical protein [Candidatus Krumholzibacteria bacterium]